MLRSEVPSVEMLGDTGSAEVPEERELAFFSVEVGLKVSRE